MSTTFCIQYWDCLYIYWSIIYILTVYIYIDCLYIYWLVIYILTIYIYWSFLYKWLFIKHINFFILQLYCYKYFRMRLIYIFSYFSILLGIFRDFQVFVHICWSFFNVFSIILSSSSFFLIIFALVWALLWPLRPAPAPRQGPAGRPQGATTSTRSYQKSKIPKRS